MSSLSTNEKQFKELQERFNEMVKGMQALREEKAALEKKSRTCSSRKHFKKHQTHPNLQSFS